MENRSSGHLCQFLVKDLEFLVAASFVLMLIPSIIAYPLIRCTL